MPFSPLNHFYVSIAAVNAAKISSSKFTAILLVRYAPHRFTELRAQPLFSSLMAKIAA